MNITKNENKEKTIPSKRDNITLLKNQNNYKNKAHKKECIKNNNIEKINTDIEIKDNLENDKENNSDNKEEQWQLDFINAFEIYSNISCSSGEINNINDNIIAKIDNNEFIENELVPKEENKDNSDKQNKSLEDGKKSKKK